MIVILKFIDGNSIILEVKPTHRIKDVKTTIETKVGIASIQIRLFFGTIQLKDDNTLQSYGIQNGCALVIVHGRRGSMQIFVKSDYKKPFMLEVNPTDDIKTIKALIRQHEGISPKQQRLILGYKQLEEGATLEDYCVHKDSTLKLIQDNCCSMNICVKTLSGKRIFFEIDLDEHIEDIKTLIQWKEGIPNSEQRLFFGSIELEGNNTLAKYGIHNDSTLKLFIRYTNNLKIFVTRETQKPILLEVAPSYSIEDIKVLIQEQEGILKERTSLIFEGTELENRKSLSNYGIYNLCTLNLIVHIVNAYIVVKQPNGKKIFLGVNLNERIEKIKARIQEQKHISKTQQRLFFAGKQLDNLKSLQDYGVKNGSTIYLTFRFDISMSFLKLLLEKDFIQCNP
jgi:ubiquitin C